MILTDTATQSASGNYGNELDTPYFAELPNKSLTSRGKLVSYTEDSFGWGELLSIRRVYRQGILSPTEMRKSIIKSCDYDKFFDRRMHPCP